MQNKWPVHVALTTAGLIYGANYVIAKNIMPDHMGAFGLIVFRVFFAGCLFWIFNAIFIREKITGKRDFRRFIFVAIFGVGVNMLAFFKGLELTSPVNASIIMTLVPIIVLIGSHFILNESITRIKVFGIVFGATGALLLVSSKGVSFQNQTFIGDLLIVVNAAFYGIYLVIVKPLMAKYHPFTVIKWIFTTGFFLVLPFGVPELMAVEWQLIPPQIWASIIYVIIGTTFCTYLLTAWALKRVNPSVAGSYVYLQPVFASAIAVIFTHEILSPDKILYAGLIFLGVYLVSK